MRFGRATSPARPRPRAAAATGGRRPRLPPAPAPALPPRNGPQSRHPMRPLDQGHGSAAAAAAASPQKIE